MPSQSISRRLVLVEGHLEGIGAAVLFDHGKQIKEILGGKHGIYALYKHDRLYYVGLAKNLFKRLRQHTRDKHRRKWNKFSAYVTRKESQVKELESLALRILSPTGNAVGGRLKSADNLKPELARELNTEHTRKVANLLGGQYSQRARRRAAKSSKGKELLSVVSSKRRRLWARHKGEDYEAVLLRSGAVRFDGEDYSSPSAAAKAVVGRPSNGWNFWHYSAGRGMWEPLRELRR